MNSDSTFFGFFGKLISSTDAASSMRWCFVFTYVLLNTTVWIVWASLSIANMRMEPWTTELGLAYAAGLTVATGGKLLQAKWQTEEETKVKRDEGIAEVAITKEELK